MLWGKCRSIFQGELVFTDAVADRNGTQKGNEAESVGHLYPVYTDSSCREYLL